MKSDDQILVLNVRAWIGSYGLQKTASVACLDDLMHMLVWTVLWAFGAKRSHNVKGVNMSMKHYFCHDGHEFQSMAVETCYLQYTALA